MMLSALLGSFYSISILTASNLPGFGAVVVSAPGDGEGNDSGKLFADTVSFARPAAHVNRRDPEPSRFQIYRPTIRRQIESRDNGSDGAGDGRTAIRRATCSHQLSGRWARFLISGYSPLCATASLAGKKPSAAPARPR